MFLYSFIQQTHLKPVLCRRGWEYRNQKGKAVAARVQEGLEELSYVEGQEGQR